VIIYTGVSETNNVQEKDRELNDISKKEDDSTTHMFSGKAQTSTAPREQATTVKSPVDRGSVEKSSKNLKQEPIFAGLPSKSETVPSDALETLKTTNLRPFESPPRVASLNIKSEL
jgi:hypothetical protein